MTTDSSPDADRSQLVDHSAADLLQGELVQVVEEELHSGEYDHEEDYDGDQVCKGNDHRSCQTWRQNEGGMVPGKETSLFERSKILSSPDQSP